jgi:O-methyltransferase
MDMARAARAAISSALFKARQLTTDKHAASDRHGHIMSWATYSPWQINQEFLEAYDYIKENTMVDIYRCYELWHLAKQVSPLCGDILEVGSWRGGTGNLMARADRGMVYLCETFSGCVKAGPHDIYSGGEHADVNRAQLAKMLRHNTILVPGVFPDETGHMIEYKKFKLCHIDVDTHDSAKDVFEWVRPRMVPGGVIVFDDFGFASTPGITRLVHEIEADPGVLCIQNLNGHAVIVLPRGAADD